jgi:hypothetical protein
MLSLCTQRRSQIEYSRRVTGVKFNRSAQRGDSGIQLTTLPTESAQIGMSAGEIGLELHSSPITRRRVIELALPLEGEPKIVPCLGAWSERNDTPKAARGSIEHAELSADRTEQKPRLVIKAIPGAYLFEKRLGLLQSILLEQLSRLVFVSSEFCGVGRVSHGS